MAWFVRLEGGGDVAGWNDPSEAPDMGEVEDAIGKLTQLEVRALPPDRS